MTRSGSTRRIWQSYPDRGPILYRLSNLYRLEKDNEKAFKAARRSLKVAMDSIAALAGDTSPTVQSFENALDAQRNRLDALYGIGRFSALTGMKMDLGLESLTTLLRQLPEKWRWPRVWGHYRLGRIHARRGGTGSGAQRIRNRIEIGQKAQGRARSVGDTGLNYG